MNDEQRASEDGAIETPQVIEKRGQRWIYIAVIVLVVASATVYVVMRSGRTGVSPDVNVCSMVEMGTRTPRFASKIIQDPETGRDFISNTVIVGFSKGVSMADICQLIHDQDGMVVQRFTNVPLFLIEVPDKGDGEVARRTLRRFLDSGIVDDALLNYVDAPTRATTTDTLANPEDSREGKGL
jgi:hypothetical protein